MSKLGKYIAASGVILGGVASVVFFLKRNSGPVHFEAKDTSVEPMGEVTPFGRCLSEIMSVHKGISVQEGLEFCAARRDFMNSRDPGSFERRYS